MGDISIINNLGANEIKSSGVSLDQKVTLEELKEKYGLSETDVDKIGKHTKGGTATTKDLVDLGFINVARTILAKNASSSDNDKLPASLSGKKTPQTSYSPNELPQLLNKSIK